MRIISGKLKGRKIEGFDLDGTRPTMERVKESLFAMIQNNIKEAKVLDLFSGSGNLGIEAISEGAHHATLVDNNRKAIQTIEKNIRNLQIEEQVKVIYANFKKVFITLQQEKFDIIFLDPPYKTNYIEESIEKIKEYHLLEEEGIIICESSSLDKIIYPSDYTAIKNKKYGDKYIVILKKV